VSLPGVLHGSLVSRNFFTMDVKDSHCIFLDELEHPMLANICTTDLQAVQNLCSAAGVLWAIQGAQIESTNPESSMAIFLARCIRSENPFVY